MSVYQKKKKGQEEERDESEGVGAWPAKPFSFFCSQIFPLKKE